MHRQIFLLISILCLFSSCEKGLFNAGGITEREILFPDSFSTIEVKNTFDITLVQDTVNKAIIYCGENLISDVSIEVSNDALNINHSVKYNWSREYEKIKITLHLKTFPVIYIRKPCSLITKDTIKTKSFTVVVWQSRFAIINACIDADFCGIYMTSDDFGTYKIRGKAKICEIKPWGSGFVDCRNLITENCTIQQRSIADTYINVTKNLSVEFGGKGNIYCYGNPESVEYKNQPTQGKLVLY